MDKRAPLRKYYSDKENQSKLDAQHELQLKKLDSVSNDIVSAIGVLIQFLDGKTSKTEVVNQLKSVSTPDVDKVVQAVSKLDKDILANKLDLQPLINELRSVKRELTLVPGKIKTPEQKDSIKVTNLSEIKLDTTKVEQAIKKLKLDPKIEVKPTDVNIEHVDLKPLKDELLNVVNAIKSQKYPEFPRIEPTDLTKLEKESKKHTKLLTEIKDKPVGSGGGGGNGTPYVDATGKPLNVELETDGSIPVTVVAGGGSSTPNYTTRIETDSVNSNLTYIGNAVIGTAESTSAWQIKRLDSTTGLIKLWRDGDDSFNNQWSTRESGSYS